MGEEQELYSKGQERDHRSCQLKESISHCETPSFGTFGSFGMKLLLNHYSGLKSCHESCINFEPGNTTLP